MTEKLCPQGHVIGAKEKVCARDGRSPLILENPDPQKNAPNVGAVVPFQDLKYGELQKIARDAGVKPYQLKAKLVTALKRKLKVEGI